MGSELGISPNEVMQIHHSTVAMTKTGRLAGHEVKELPSSSQELCGQIREGDRSEAQLRSAFQVLLFILAGILTLGVYPLVLSITNLKEKALADQKDQKEKQAGAEFCQLVKEFTQNFKEESLGLTLAQEEIRDQMQKFASGNVPSPSQFEKDLTRPGTIIDVVDNEQAYEPVASGSANGGLEKANALISDLVSKGPSDMKWRPVLEGFSSQTLGNACDVSWKIGTVQLTSDFSAKFGNLKGPDTTIAMIPKDFKVELNILRNPDHSIREIQVTRLGVYQPVLSGPHDPVARTFSSKVESQLKMTAYFDDQGEINFKDGHTSHTWIDEDSK